MKRNKPLLWVMLAAGLGVSVSADSQTLWNGGALYSPVVPVVACGAGKFDYSVACNSTEYVFFGP